MPQEGSDSENMVLKRGELYLLRTSAEDSLCLQLSTNVHMHMRKLSIQGQVKTAVKKQCTELTCLGIVPFSLISIRLENLMTHRALDSVLISLLTHSEENFSLR